ETYAGGPEVSAWNSIAMTAQSDPALPANILPPTYRATRFAAAITGQQNVLIDYYVEAADNAGNIAKTDIQHVWVGQNTPVGDVVTITPNPAQAGQNVQIKYNPAGRRRAGAAGSSPHSVFNIWNRVIPPAPAMTWNASTLRWEITIVVASNATQLDLVFNNGSGTWDNNSGQDWHFPVTGAVPLP